MKYLSIIWVFLIAFCCCNNPSNNLGNDAKSPVFIDKNEVSEKELEVEIILERGAFHYDKFILKDTTITFYPPDELFYQGDDESAEKYMRLSKQEIPKQVVQNFVDKLLKGNIWKMKSLYKEEGSCTSLLHVRVRINDKSIEVKCDDFHRSCPELIQFIETEMVRLHGVGLERVYLPG